ncbi:MAG: hypothetical protein H6598_03295 [Flavobacteriales bacterium]|nr:hypothetical protein [Flavobacteriales bacterium]
MLEGAIIGVIVAIVMIIVKKNKEKKALAKVNNDDLIDQPDFAAFFHCASEKTFEKNGLKFFDSNGALTLNGTMLTYQPEQKGHNTLSVDLSKSEVHFAPEKRKMQWLEITVDGEKHFFTSFVQNAFSLDKSAMDEFVSRVKQINSSL